MKIVHCCECKHSTCWRSGELARKFGKAMECSLHIISCPDDYDFCSYGERIIKCSKCGRRFDYNVPNYCPECGEKVQEVEE
jgi:ABC-type ATPase with predicted acetyltransferase domain